jgi:hypothetical protein
VTRHPAPSRDQVLAALATLRQEAETGGRRPSVLALARQASLANTTFRRRFPDLVSELSKASVPAPGPGPISRYEQLNQDNAKLRQSNRDLRDNLELAIASIQRLTLDNHRLHKELEAVTKISRIRPAPASPR